MIDKINSIFFYLFLFLTLSVKAYAEGPDLSGVDVDVEYKLGPDGRWVYQYTVNNDTQTVLSTLFVDLSCPQGTEIRDDISNLDQRQGYLDRAEYPEFFSTVQEAHVPAKVFAEHGTALRWGISADNEAMWSLKVQPYTVRTGLVITSKGNPTSRRYHITPYPLLPSDDNHRPHLEEDDNDYALYGLIKGPSCQETSGLEEPVMFEGTPPRSMGIPGRNDLLTYAKPLRTNLSVSETENTLEMQIHYSDEIDPDTFKAEPGWARRLFTPIPGESETVTLSVNMGTNHIRLEASTGRTTPADSLQDNRDIDVFMITKRHTAPGQRKKQ